MSNRLFVSVLVFVLLPFSVFAQPKLKVLDTRVIYDNSSYCAFTSLTQFHGKIVLLESDDTKEWNKVAVYSDDSTDCRDPKIKKTPNGDQLLLIYHKHRIYKNRQTGAHSVVRIFDEGVFDSGEKKITVGGNEQGCFVLWNATRYKNKLYASEIVGWSNL